jgi:hypothetical protein
MRVSLNLKPCLVPEDIASFKELLAFLELERIPAGQVITRIIVDGEEWDQDAEAEHADAVPNNYNMIEVASSRTIDLAKEGLTDANELLPSLAEDMPLVAAELRRDDVRDGLEMFSRCIEVISWYVSLITACDVIFGRSDPGFRIDPAATRNPEDMSLDADLTALTVEEGPEMRTFASVENLRQKLLAVERAQENNDTILLADLIEYELLPIVNIWIEEVPVLLSKISREGGTA